MKKERGRKENSVRREGKRKKKKMDVNLASLPKKTNHIHARLEGERKGLINLGKSVGENGLREPLVKGGFC